jgi:hypothetical protein
LLHSFANSAPQTSRPLSRHDVGELSDRDDRAR